MYDEYLSWPAIRQSTFEAAYNYLRSHPDAYRGLVYDHLEELINQGKFPNLSASPPPKMPYEHLDWLVTQGYFAKEDRYLSKGKNHYLLTPTPKGEELYKKVWESKNLSRANVLRVLKKVLDKDKDLDLTKKREILKAMEEEMEKERLSGFPLGVKKDLIKNLLSANHQISGVKGNEA